MDFAVLVSNVRMGKASCVVVEIGNGIHIQILGELATFLVCTVILPFFIMFVKKDYSFPEYAHNEL